MKAIDDLMALVTPEAIEEFEASRPDTLPGRNLGVVADDELKRLFVLERIVGLAFQEAEEKFESARRNKGAVMRLRRAANNHDIVCALLCSEITEHFGEQISQKDWLSDEFRWDIAEGWRFHVYMQEDIPADELQDLLDGKGSDRRKLH